MSVSSTFRRFDFNKFVPQSGIVARWIRDEQGAVAVEYGLILAGVFLTMVGSLYAFGDQLKAMLQFVADTVSAALK